MGKQAPTIEWKIPQDDAEWAHLCAPTPAANTNRRSLIRLLCEGAVCLLLLGCVGGWWWHTNRAEWQQTTTDAAETTWPQEDAMTQSVKPATASMSDALRGASWQDPYSHIIPYLQGMDPDVRLNLSLDNIDVKGDRAVARLVAKGPDGIPVYRQMRFYRISASGWIRTAPDVALWGPSEQFETPFFVYHFRQKDASAVTAVAPQVDALYTTLRHNWGLPMKVDEEKAVITVSLMRRSTYYAHSQGNAPPRINVPSPALY